MKFGIACGPGYFSTASRSTGVIKMVDLFQLAGAEYLEFAVGEVEPEGPLDAVNDLKAALAGLPLQPETFNCFIPEKYKITGPGVNLPALLEYCRRALGRCATLGAQVVVLGSGRARSYPDGFDRVVALNQFVEFGQALGPIAATNGIIIAVEPLNRSEDNLVCSIRDGIAVVDAIQHPHIQLLADLYHISVENEPLEEISKAGARLVHTHCADLGRTAPGFAVDGEENFLGFFTHLRGIGYNSRCTYEGSLDHLQTRAQPLLSLLKCHWQQSSQL